MGGSLLGPCTLSSVIRTPRAARGTQLLLRVGRWHSCDFSGLVFEFKTQKLHLSSPEHWGRC